MLEALLSGVTDPDQLAELAKARMRSKIPQLREALANRFQIEHHGILVAQLLAHIDTLDAAIINLDEKIQAMLAPHATTVELLCTIPGVAVRTAQVLIAECGLDMTVFGTSGRLVSWARRSPQTRQSGRKTTTGRAGKGNPYLNGMLGEIAASASRTDTFLGERYRRIARRRGKRKALAAIARSILVIIFHLLADRTARFHDLGPGWYDTYIDKQRKVRNLIRQLEALGYPIPPAAAEAAAA